MDLAEVAAAFGGLLHAAGVLVSPERGGRFATAVTLVRPATLAELYWAGRVTLVGGQPEIEVYDRVFGQVFGGRADVADWRGQAPPSPSAGPVPGTGVRPADGLPPASDGDGDDRDDGDDGPRGTADPAPPPAAGADDGGGLPPEADRADVLAAASAEERLGHTDFAAMTDDELASLRRLIAALPLATPARASRRAVRHPRGRAIDLRATLRRARATGGDPVVRVFRRRTQRPRHLVLIADVSGSMAPYARAYLHLLHGAVRATRADAFVFATRLTRLTRQLAAADPDVALHRALAAAPDWSGGTRIGEALAAFLDDHGRRGMARGAVVVIVSDGWDTGDPAALGEQMARLARLAHRIIWVNPRKAATGFQPLVAGMAAALPHVDTFVSGHSVAALDEVIAAIGAGEVGR
ncbi:MAG TPA: VWA domain-containing protein [Acidimicrobiales bacterium]